MFRYDTIIIRQPILPPPLVAGFAWVRWLLFGLLAAWSTFASCCARLAADLLEPGEWLREACKSHRLLSALFFSLFNSPFLLLPLFSWFHGFLCLWNSAAAQVFCLLPLFLPNSAVYDYYIYKCMATLVLLQFQFSFNCKLFNSTPPLSPIAASNLLYFISL